MCEIMQKIQDEGREEGRIEGRMEERTSMALDMLRDRKPIEEIVKYSRLSEERIKELALQLH